MSGLLSLLEVRGLFWSSGFGSELGLLLPWRDDWSAALESWASGLTMSSADRFREFEGLSDEAI